MVDGTLALTVSKLEGMSKIDRILDNVDPVIERGRYVDRGYTPVPDPRVA
jgi:hypothetical protein